MLAWLTITPYACTEAHDCLSDSLIFGSGSEEMNAELLLFFRLFCLFPPTHVGFHDFKGVVSVFGGAYPAGFRSSKAVTYCF